MCRILAVMSRRPLAISPHLEQLARIARDSREYQGHGWGCAWIEDGRWRVYRDIRPIWEDSFDRFGQTRFLLAHARSAFRNEDIVVENNMPFIDGPHAFIFNGELHGVRIRAEGRIGAEKLFRFIRRFDGGDMLAALKKSLPIVQRRSAYVRAANIVIGDGEKLYLHSSYREDPEYFTMHMRKTADEVLVCSERYAPEADGWAPVRNGEFMEVSL
jgi:glutamine amidotransferase